MSGGCDNVKDDREWTPLDVAARNYRDAKAREAKAEADLAKAKADTKAALDALGKAAL